MTDPKAKDKIKSIVDSAMIEYAINIATSPSKDEPRRTKEDILNTSVEKIFKALK